MKLARNKISGTIPMKLFTLEKIDSIDFSDNSLTGEIPNEVVDGSIISYCKITFLIFRY